MKDIKNYEGLYAITSCGKVWSYKRKKFLKPFSNGRGYLKVFLCKDGEKKQYYLHRLVAEAYLENPNNYPQVNHKDENKSNNVSSNLEWCNHSYNALYGTCQERLRKYKQKAVEMMDKDTKIVIKTFESMKIAAESLGIHKEQISDVCRKKRKTAGGYIWRYALWL